MRALHTSILRLEGIGQPANWAEPDRTCELDINAEVYDDERLAYVGVVCRESGSSIRVDLDRAQWAALAKAANEVVARFDASDMPGGLE